MLFQAGDPDLLALQDVVELRAKSPDRFVQVAFQVQHHRANSPPDLAVKGCLHLRDRLIKGLTLAANVCVEDG